MRGAEKKEVVLGTVGIVDAGVYAPDKTYNNGMFVLHNGSTWLALKNNLLGVTPEEGENWKYLARGFASEMLSLITAIDSQGLLGDKGAEVSGQDLFDKFADMVANKVIQKNAMSNVSINDPNKVPTSALAFNMQEQITSNKNLVDQLNRDMQNCYPLNKLYPISGTFRFDHAGKHTITFSRPLAHKYLAIISATATRLSIENATANQATLVNPEVSDRDAYVSALIYCVY